MVKSKDKIGNLGLVPYRPMATSIQTVKTSKMRQEAHRSAVSAAVRLSLLGALSMVLSVSPVVMIAGMVSGIAIAHFIDWLR